MDAYLIRAIIMIVCFAIAAWFIFKLQKMATKVTLGIIFVIAFVYLWVTQIQPILIG